jgi:sigma-B regulation protein RsbU (phosphoserine phosphatase)
MPVASDLFERLLALSRFDGDSRAALILLHRYFSLDFRDCSLALLLVRDQGAGRCRLAGLIGPDGTEHLANLDPNGHRSTLPLFDDALAARLTDGTQAHVAAIAPTERGLPLAQVLFASAAVLAIPLANAGELSHWLVFGSTLAHRFDRVDVERILLHVNLATSLIVRPIVLRELTRETERQRHEIESLADIQKLLLPDNPRIRGLDYAVHWQPAATAAGDYYEMSNLTAVVASDIPAIEDADVWGVIVGDVSGHGVAAAAEAMQFDAILRTFHGGDGEPPANVISYANRHFFSRRNRGRFMTVFALLYRPDARRLRFLSAGHPPLLLRRNLDVSLLGEADQIPLGVLPDFAYANNAHDAQKGDIFVLYTDGIVEARDAHGREFGMSRLRQLVAAADTGISVQALRDTLVAAVHEHQDSTVGHDDQTLLVLRIAH